MCWLEDEFVITTIIFYVCAREAPSSALATPSVAFECAYPSAYASRELFISV